MGTFNPKDFHVIAPIFNPMGFKSRLKQYINFEKHMIDLGVSLYVIECAYGKREFEIPESSGVTHIKVRTNSVMFNKENLGNLALTRLPHYAEKIGCFDADILFRNKNIVQDTCNALDLYPILQPWQMSYDLGPNDEHLADARSLGYLYSSGQKFKVAHNEKQYEYAHTGYAWAYTRDALNTTGGLLETNILGSADYHMGHGILGNNNRIMPKLLTEDYQKYIYNWEKRALKLNKKLGCVAGTLEHSFHGLKGERGYSTRGEILIKHQFKPSEDLTKNAYGVLEFTGNKPMLQMDILRYFGQRREDVVW
jgi:hypothetical protein